MEIIFLGTNGWYDTPAANTLSILIKSRKYDIVLDAGNGIAKLDRYIDGGKPVYLFLSHFHLDHVVGLHVLLKFNFRKGLTICGGKGARRHLAALLRRPFSVPLRNLGYNAEVMELPAEAAAVPFKCTSLPLLHADPVLGYRFELDGRTVAFCTDTGYCDNSLKLAAGADLLVSECTNLPGEETKRWPHMNPENSAELALKAGVKKLALVHFEPNKYPTLNSRKNAAALVHKKFKGVFAPPDGFRMKL